MRLVLLLLITKIKLLIMILIRNILSRPKILLLGNTMPLFLTDLLSFSLPRNLWNKLNFKESQLRLMYGDSLAATASNLNMKTMVTRVYPTKVSLKLKNLTTTWLS